MAVSSFLRLAVRLEFALTLFLEPGEAVLLVDQLRDGRHRAARFQLVVLVTGGEFVELRYALENLSPLPQPAIAELVDVRQDLPADVVLAELRLRVDPPLDAGEEGAVNATSAAEEHDVFLAAGKQRNRVDDGVEDIRGVMEGQVGRHSSSSTSTGAVVC